MNGTPLFTHLCSPLLHRLCPCRRRRLPSPIPRVSASSSGVPVHRWPVAASPAPSASTVRIC
uniref:Uncharacterized protein n=1 Tax=Oryza nivara TaxID=4536 RepID=A0A0E0J6U4_ORYNI